MIKMSVQEFVLRTGKTYKGANGETPITTAYGLYHACDIKSPTMAGQIWKGVMVKVGLTTIEALCRGLKCSAGDLFEITPEIVIEPGPVEVPAVRAPAEVPAPKARKRPAKPTGKGKAKGKAKPAAKTRLAAGGRALRASKPGAAKARVMNYQAGQTGSVAGLKFGPGKTKTKGGKTEKKGRK